MILYHISETAGGPLVDLLKPIPAENRNLGEDHFTPRIQCAPTIELCVQLRPDLVQGIENGKHPAIRVYRIDTENPYPIGCEPAVKNDALIGPDELRDDHRRLDAVENQEYWLTDAVRAKGCDYVVNGIETKDRIAWSCLTPEDVIGVYSWMTTHKLKNIPDTAQRTARDMYEHIVRQNGRCGGMLKKRLMQGPLGTTHEVTELELELLRG